MKLLIKGNQYDIEVVEMNDKKIRFRIDTNQLDLHDGFYILDGDSMYYAEYKVLHQDSPRWMVEFSKFKPVVLSGRTK